MSDGATLTLVVGFGASVFFLAGWLLGRGRGLYGTDSTESDLVKGILLATMVVMAIVVIMWSVRAFA